MTLNPLPLLGSFLGGIQTYLIVGAVSAALAGVGGAYAGYRWEAGALSDLKAADATALALAVQAQAASDARQAGVNLNAAVMEAQAQDALNVQFVNFSRKVPIYVTTVQDARGCISVGLQRVLRAAADKADPASLQLAPGQSDDDCSDVPTSEVAGWFTDFAAVSYANSEQLNALETWVRDNHAAQ